MARRAGVVSSVLLLSAPLRAEAEPGKFCCPSNWKDAGACGILDLNGDCDKGERCDWKGEVGPPKCQRIMKGAPADASKGHVKHPSRYHLNADLECCPDNWHTEHCDRKCPYANQVCVWNRGEAGGRPKCQTMRLKGSGNAGGPVVKRSGGMVVGMPSKGSSADAEQPHPGRECCMWNWAGCASNPAKFNAQRGVCPRGQLCYPVPGPGPDGQECHDAGSYCQAMVNLNTGLVRNQVQFRELDREDGDSSGDYSFEYSEDEEADEREEAEDEYVETEDEYGEGLTDDEYGEEDRISEEEDYDERRRLLVV
eukprot:TRINITY_DN94926_c0_g1_i1.p1 TRINITY_DN94926_c0_g1~~TRINITY_DN94926_c0_g1_i1.p1  ORF type:complete len:310 (+),score=41.65 TRINITY_DN94926_c0_g1_i1:116-1045(+)